MLMAPYLYRNHKVVADAGMRVAPLPLPSPPLSGWESVSQEIVAEVAKKVPHVTSGWYVQAHRYASSARLHAYTSSLHNVVVVYMYCIQRVPGMFLFSLFSALEVARGVGLPRRGFF